MSKQIERMRKLVRQLPKNDDLLGLKFLNNREFQNLLDLVNSDIYLVSVEQDKENPKEKYKNIDLDSLVELKGEILEYISYLDVPDEYYEEEF